MPELDWEALCEDTAEYLDGDHRYWQEDQGSFQWGEHRVFFTKTQDAIVLEVGGQTRTCGRP